MRQLLTVLALLGIAQAGAAATAPVKIKVEDASGAVLKDELVIVQDLDNREREVLRALSDQDGNVPPLQLPPGLYRVIATDPYGIWQTSVREFLVGQQSAEVVVRVEAMWTHGYGDIVTVGTAHTLLQVIGPDGQPASGASILVRDRDATLHLERRYKADKKGTATIELVSEPTVVVVLYGDVLLTTELGSHDLKPVIRLEKR
jgi:hypothetical protein